MIQVLSPYVPGAVFLCDEALTALSWVFVSMFLLCLLSPVILSCLDDVLCTWCSHERWLNFPGGFAGAVRLSPVAMSALSLNGIPVANKSVTPADAEVLFTKLCAEFNIDSKVGKRLATVCGLQSLEDIRRFFHPANTVHSVVSGITGLAFPGRECSRVEQALDALNAAHKVGADKLQHGETEDLDKMLEPGELTDLRTSHQARYRSALPAWKQASDQAVSCCRREILKRLVRVHDYLKMRPQQDTTKAHRPVVTVGPFKYQPAEEIDSQVLPDDLTGLMAGMELYLHALAVAGSTALASTPAGHEPSDSDGLLWVEVPQQVVQLYLWRAQKLCSDLIEHSLIL